ncbi:hypothetical protein ACNKHQ_23775 [Shigella flexneri]
MSVKIISDTVFIGSGNHLFVADRAARLDNAAHANGGSGINAIAEREECVRKPVAEPLAWRTFIRSF